MKIFVPCVEVACWANDNDALIPELWAFEALRTLGSNMVMGALVHRDFEPLVASFGDYVNCSRPSDFTAKRKIKSDNITIQDAISTKIQVPLDQHIHVSFKIEDEDIAKAFPDLVARYLEPAARECAEAVDRILCGQVANLLSKGALSVGGLQLMSKTNAADYVLSANTQLDINRAPKANRNLVLGPRAQQAALGADLFVSTDKRGDSGTALRSASLGSVYGLDSFMDQNVNYRAFGSSEVEVAVVSGAEAIGATVVETTITTATCFAGDWIDIGGIPYRIASVTDNAGDVTANLAAPGLLKSTVANEVVTHYRSGLTGAGYAAGWSKDIVVDGFLANTNPTVGTILSIGTASYTVISSKNNSTTESAVQLDRPLEAVVADNAAVAFYPAGGVNLAFTREAIAFVSRPLATVPSGTGASSYVASYDDVAMRVTMQYDALAQGMIVTFDLLCGVAILDTRLATLLLS